MLAPRMTRPCKGLRNLLAAVRGVSITHGMIVSWCFRCECVRAVESSLCLGTLALKSTAWCARLDAGYVICGGRLVAHPPRPSKKGVLLVTADETLTRVGQQAKPL